MQSTMKLPPALSLCVLGLFAGSAHAQNASALYVMKTDGSDVRKVAETPAYSGLGHPRWSHDGKRLAFHAWEGPGNGRKVFVVNADGTQLSADGPQGQFANWSPDDKQLAFQIRSNAKNIGVWVENAGGGGRAFLFDGRSPRWSPDGGHMAFISDVDLAVRDLAVDGDKNLTAQMFEGIREGFDWSPDGRQLAFVARRQGRLGLWIVDIKNPAPRLRLESHLMGQLSWSPDGKQLAVTLNSLIHLLNVNDAGQPRLIPGQVGTSRDPAWSPDGKSIAISSTRGAKQP